MSKGKKPQGGGRTTPPPMAYRVKLRLVSRNIIKLILTYEDRKGGMEFIPPMVFCPLLKKSSGNLYLKFLDFSLAFGCTFGTFCTFFLFFGSIKKNLFSNPKIFLDFWDPLQTKRRKVKISHMEFWIPN